MARGTPNAAGLGEKPTRRLSAGGFPVGFQASGKGKGLILPRQEAESRKPGGDAEQGAGQSETPLPGDLSRGDGGESGASGRRGRLAHPVLHPPGTGLGTGGCAGTAEHPRRQAALGGDFRERSRRAGRVSLWERLLSNLTREQE